MQTEKVSFSGAYGDSLSAKIDYPDRPEDVKGWVLFAHGFSIGKDLKPIRTISKALVEEGYGMLRFDFTGLVLSAAAYLRQNQKPPCVLIGHSFGGTAMLKVAQSIPEVKAISTIGSPCDTKHIVHQFADKLEEIEEEGEAKVLLGGRPFTIKEQFIDDVENQNMAEEISELDRALLIFHSPQDAVVNIDNASHIYVKAKHPKSFVSLDGADHLLLKNPADADYVGRVLAAWASRYVIGSHD